MPYVKPGVEITQINRTQSPVLSSPELETVIVGTPYKWIAPEKNDQYTTTNHTMTIVATATNFVISGVSAEFGYVPVGASAMVVDLINKANGTKIRLYSDGTNHFTFASDIVTIDAGARDIISAGTTYTLVTGEKYIVQLGFIGVLQNTGFRSYDNATDLINEQGEPYSWNNLGFGAYLAMMNAGKSINVYSTLLPAVDLKTSALDALDIENFYSMAIMENDTSTSAVTLSATLTTWADPSVKKERIAFINIDNSASTIDGMTSAIRATNAATIASASSGLANKRVFSTFPTIAYVREFRHVSTLRSAFISASIDAKFSTVISSLNCKLVTDITGADNIVYKAGTKITDAIWDILVGGGFGSTSAEVEVLAPVPGYYYAAAAAGSAINVSVEQPMTNLSIAGINRTYGSADLFSELNLNTIAEGGNYIFVQDNPNSSIYCRHQLSTNMLSGEAKELSITRQVDFAAMFIRKALKKYAGKFNITPGLLKTIRANLTGIKEYLVSKGYIADVTIGNIYQDTISLDTVRAEVTLTVKYPANNIKIDLVI